MKSHKKKRKEKEKTLIGSSFAGHIKRFLQRGEVIERKEILERGPKGPIFDKI